MTFTLQQPLYLAGLLALLLPLAIHLWNRREGKKRMVGSVKWLKETETPRFSSVKLSEWVLMLLRMALLAVAVLLMAGLATEQEETAPELADKVWLVEEALLAEPLVRQQVDSLLQNDVPVRFFAPGFPELPGTAAEEQPGANLEINYWSLLQEFDVREDLPRKAVVMAKAPVQAFRGERAAVAKQVEWLPFPQKEPVTFVARALQTPEGTVATVGNSDENRTAFSQVAVQDEQGLLQLVNRGPESPAAVQMSGNSGSVPVQPADSLHIGLWHSPAWQQDARYLQAALQAVSEFSPRLNLRISLHQTANFLEDDALPAHDWLFWLSDEAFPQEKYLQQGQKQVLAQPGKLTSGFFQPFPEAGAGAFSLSQRLDPALNPAVLEGGLPAELLQLLLPENTLAKATVKTNDRRQLPAAQLFTRSAEPLATGKQSGQENRSPQFVFWLLLLGLVVAERTLATFRKS